MLHVRRLGLLAVPVFALIGCSAAPSSTESVGSSGNDESLDDAALSQVKQVPFKSVCADVVADGMAHCHAKVQVNPDGSVAAAAAPGGLGPKDLASAYKIPTTTSTATIAIVDAQDDPDAEADLATYRNTYGLPPCTTANGCFKKVDQNGGTSYPKADTGWAGEIMLDIEMASAACPSCKILLVEATSATTANLGTAVNTAARLGASVISNSYGGGESRNDASFDSTYYHHAGVAIFASAGDNGYGVEYPAAGQYVIGVGGTTLTKSSSTRGWAEAVWSGSGSGCSRYTTKPSWQTDTGCSKKTVADLSAIADPNTGVAVYDRYGSGGWAVYGGTSVASPLVASIFAATGHTNATGADVWQHTGDFFDVTSGKNGSCSKSTAYLCTGEKGYDGPTGWGTPNAATWAGL